MNGNVTHVDHIIPHSKGGLTTIENAQLVFADENLNKSDVEFYINGPTNNRLPGNLNFCLKDVDADWLTSMLPDIAMARGSACTSETIQPSHVLRGIGLSDEDANSSLRVSFGRFTTKDDINYATDKIIENVQKYLSKKKMLAI